MSFASKQRPEGDGWCVEEIWELAALGEKMFDFRELIIPDNKGAQYHLLAMSSSEDGLLEVLTLSSSGVTDEQTIILRQYNRVNRTFKYLGEGDDLVALKRNPESSNFAELTEGSISELILNAVEKLL